MSRHTHTTTIDAFVLKQWVDRYEGGSLPDTLIGFLMRGLSAVALWHERAGQRRRLAELDDYLLKDIGVTRAEARMEAEKPFWH